MALQDLTDRTVDLTIGNQYGIDLGATSADMTLKIDDFRDRYIEPKIADLASTIEAQVMSDNVPLIGGVVGDYGPFDDFDLVLEANQKLSDQLAPKSDRIMYIGNKAERDAVNAFKAFFNSQSEVGRQYETGRMGIAGGFDWYSSSLVPTMTRGTANKPAMVMWSPFANVPVPVATTMVVAPLAGMPFST